MKTIFKRMTASKHFIERYNERVLHNEREVSKDELECFLEGTEAEFIVNAKYHTNNQANYFLYTMNSIPYVIVTNESNQSLITIIDIDYGFGEELNSIITEKTMEQIRERQMLVNEKQEIINDENDKLESKIDANKQKIESLQREIDSIKAINNGLINQKETNILSKAGLSEELNRLAYKVIYNINYNLDKVR